jgi:hypothetical protein
MTPTMGHPTSSHPMGIFILKRAPFTNQPLNYFKWGLMHDPSLQSNTGDLALSVRTKAEHGRALGINGTSSI